MTLAQIQAILKSSNETPEGKAILILQLVSVSVSTHANQLAGAAHNNATIQSIINAMLVDAGNMMFAAKAAATAPSKPVV